MARGASEEGGDEPEPVRFEPVDRKSSSQGAELPVFEAVEPPEPPEEGDGPPEEQDRDEPAYDLAIAALACAVGAVFAFFLLGLVAPILGYLVFIAGAISAIVFGIRAVRMIDAQAGIVAGRGIAITAVVIGILQVGTFLVLPLLGLLICLLTGGSGGGTASSNPECCNCGSACEGCGCPDCGCDGCDAACDGCCQGCGCSDCGCGDCGACDCNCGDCGCGGCGSCDCGCGDCGCDCGCGDCGACDCGCGDCGGGCCLWRWGPGLASEGAGGKEAHQGEPPEPVARSRFDRYTAHHPATTAYEQDVYRLGRHRLCIGCFTTYPVFLVAVAVLLLASLPGPWWGWVVGGAGLAFAQIISSAGLARTRWAKATVKTLLGVGLAGILVGVRMSPWSLVAQTVLLLGILGVAMASAIPRSIRIAQATEGGCGCRETTKGNAEATAGEP